MLAAVEVEQAVGAAAGSGLAVVGQRQRAADEELHLQLAAGPVVEADRPLSGRATGGAPPGVAMIEQHAVGEAVEIVGWRLDDREADRVAAVVADPAAAERRTGLDRGQAAAVTQLGALLAASVELV